MTGFQIIFRDGLNACVKECHDISVSKGWWEKERNDGELLALIHSEVSEALEGLRKDINDDHIPQFKMVEAELADACIRIFDMAAARNYRLAEAIIAKMEYNKTRPHKHGGKKF